MTHGSGLTQTNAPNIRRIAEGGERPPALVHIVNADEKACSLIAAWLEGAGIPARIHSHLGAFLTTLRPDVAGCLVIDAHPGTVSGLESQAILLPWTVDLPLVVTADHADDADPFAPRRSGIVGLVRKPLNEQATLAAIRAAIEIDRCRRLLDSHCADVRARFETLTPRERQVMELVTSGMLNKQVGQALSLSEITVKVHRGSAVRKMAARSLAELVRMADLIAGSWRSEELIRFGSSVPARIVAGADRRSGYSQGQRGGSMFRAAELYPEH